MLSIIIQMFISSVYKGGGVAFERDFHTFVTGDNRFIISPKSDKVLSNEFCDKLEELASGMNFVPVYAVASNFQDMSPEEAQGIFRDFMEENLAEFGSELSLVANCALIDVTAVALKKDSDKGQEIIRIFKSADFLVNFRIQFEDETFYQIAEAGSGIEPTHKIELATGKPERNIKINDDDITDLKIALGSAETIDDFIAMM